MSYHCRSRLDSLWHAHDATNESDADLQANEESLRAVQLLLGHTKAALNNNIYNSAVLAYSWSRARLYADEHEGIGDAGREALAEGTRHPQ